MARIPTKYEIQNEMASIGGGNDYFAAQARLQHKFDEAERAVEKLKPVLIGTDAAWSMEPTADEVLHEAKQKSLTVETAREDLRAKLAADARRLASFSADAATEISEALAEAEAARDRAANVLAAHEAALSAVTAGILSVGNIRRTIAVVKTLAVDDGVERYLAKTALDFWVEQKTTSETVRNTTGFRAFADDLVWRRALNSHIAEYVKPFEDQVSGLIVKIKAQADAEGMDLKKVLALLEAERGQRGESLLYDSNLYAGLI
jgi:hypothetical protein